MKPRVYRVGEFWYASLIEIGRLRVYCFRTWSEAIRHLLAWQ